MDPRGDAPSDTLQEGSAEITPAGPPRRTRTRRFLLGVGCAVVLIGGAAGAWFVFGREHAEQVSDDQALEEFRSIGIEVASVEGLPAPGVYPATASGTESIGLPGFDEDLGPTAPVTLTHGDEGCFTYRADFNTHHWRSWTFCPTATATFGLAGLESWTARRAPGLEIDSLTTYRCDEPVDFFWADAEKGESRTGSCTGTNDFDDSVTADAAELVVLGHETLRVGSTDVEVVRVRNTDTFSGSQTGTEVAEWWIDLSSGLPLKLSVEALLKGGPTDYSESFDLVLSTLEPST